MLIDNFFEIIETDVIEDKISARIKLNSKHKIYSGHFPNNPITPGVVQVQIVKEILEHIYKKELKLISMMRCKFLNILNPNETPFITIDISILKKTFEISVIGLEKETTYFKFFAVFSDEFIPN